MALVFLNDLNQILHNGKWEGLLSRIFPSNILIFINIVLIATLLLLSGFYLRKILSETRHKVRNILLYIMFGLLGFFSTMLIFILCIHIML